MCQKSFIPSDEFKDALGMLKAWRESGKVSTTDAFVILKWLQRARADLSERFEEFGTPDEANSDPLKRLVGRSKQDLFPWGGKIELGVTLDTATQVITLSWLTIDPR